MADNTSKALRSQTVYCVFVRNYSREGTFAAVQADLPRIRALGTDIIWLMPIHPLGEKCRKGALGSPYAVQDYRAVNPEYGTMDDFIALVDAVHEQGMRCIIDVVYNHTSPDSALATAHPEWFHRGPDGAFGSRIGDWSDVIDLDYAQPGLWDELIGTLKYWAKYVDGFRCDVAPMVPLAFWKRAREEVAQVRQDCLWLAESAEPDFIAYLRGRGMTGLSDSELYQAFDVCYDYDAYPAFLCYATGQGTLEDYAALLNLQERIYPDNYVKLRFLENHDRARAAFLVPRALSSWTAFLAFQKGMTLIYNGQEVSCDHRPTLFDRDAINWNAGWDRTAELKRLLAVKRHPLAVEGSFSVRTAGRDALVAMYAKDGRRLVGVFDFSGGNGGPLRIGLPDGEYPNLIGDGSVRVECGALCADGPAVFEA